MADQDKAADSVRAVERPLDISLTLRGASTNTLTAGELLKRVDFNRATLYSS